jgi:hypothetical protein
MYCRQCTAAVSTRTGGKGWVDTHIPISMSGPGPLTIELCAPRVCSVAYRYNSLSPCLPGHLDFRHSNPCITASSQAFKHASR